MGNRKQIKIIENRCWYPSIGWYAVYTTQSNGSKADQKRMKKLIPNIPKENNLPHGVITGLILLIEHRSVKECNNCVWATGPVCCVIASHITLKTPVIAKGRQKSWRIPEAVRFKIFTQLKHSHIVINDISILNA
jgi:hypothetical protein